MDYFDFRPAFKDVQIPEADGAIGHASPESCATEQCAIELSEIMREAGLPNVIVAGPIMGPFDLRLKPPPVTGSLKGLLTGRFENSVANLAALPLAPWLRFSDGTLLRVGPLAAAWGRNPPQVALRYALFEFWCASQGRR